MDGAMPERRVFRYGLVRVLTQSAVVFLGLVFVVHSFGGWPSRWWEFAAGALAAALALADIVLPVYVVDEEGLLLARTAGGGYPSIRPAILIQWVSIRDVQWLHPERIALGLNDDRWMTLRLGSLSRSARAEFVDTIMQRAPKLDPKALLGHGE